MRYIAAGILTLGALVALGWLALVVNRPMARYSEETRKEVYDTSRQYEQGTNRDIARYCRDMSTATTPEARKAVAGLIRSTLSTYDGHLTPDNQSCARDAGKN